MSTTQRNRTIRAVGLVTVLGYLGFGLAFTGFMTWFWLDRTE